MNVENQQCPQCHGLLPPGRTEGLCPKCLMQQGLQTSPPSLAVTQSSARAGGLPAFVAATPAELAPHFPQLEILELLGVGGMGAVYKARQPSLDRIVALKVLPREVGLDPAFAERFTREAKALARLNHPHIVTIHDIGQASGLYYIVMEYIDGANLRQMINAQSLTPRQTLALVPQLCEALQYAHDEGIVHRDIKPENILVDKRGRAKVADFGLAKMLGEQLLHTSLTATQQVMGTLRYMAPEQMLGARDVDHRADLYALGVVFYELLTGDLPLGRFPLPSEKAHCDARLDEVVLKALERERERRYQHANDIKTDVETISSSYAAAAAVETKPATTAAVAPGKLTEADFAQVADEVRRPAWGLMVVSILQVLFLIALGGSVFNISWIWGPDRPLHGPSPTWLSVGLMMTLPFALLIIAAAVQMKRLRSYEFAVIGSFVAVMPLGVSCIFTLPIGLWSLLVLLRPQVRAAFHTPVRERPGRWNYHHTPRLAALSENSFEEAADDVRAGANAMIAYGALQLVFGIALILTWLGMLSMPENGRPTDMLPGLAMLGAWHIPFSLFYMAAGFNMRRLRNYELAVIGSVGAMLPLGVGWLFSAAIGLWCLLVLKRPQTEQAFRLPLRERPERYRDNDATLLQNRAKDPAAFQRAYQRVRGRCRGAGTSLLVMSGCDAAATLALSTVMLTQSRGVDRVTILLIVVLPLLVSFVLTGCAIALLRMRNWGAALAGAILCIAPLSPLWMVRWLIGLYALLTLLRHDVRQAFALGDDEREPPTDVTPPQKSIVMPPAVYDSPPPLPGSATRLTDAAN